MTRAQAHGSGLASFPCPAGDCPLRDAPFVMPYNAAPNPGGRAALARGALDAAYEALTDLSSEIERVRELVQQCGSIATRCTSDDAALDDSDRAEVRRLDEMIKLAHDAMAEIDAARGSTVDNGHSPRTPNPEPSTPAPATPDSRLPTPAPLAERGA